MPAGIYPQQGVQHARLLLSLLTTQQAYVEPHRIVSWRHQSHTGDRMFEQALLQQVAFSTAHSDRRLRCAPATSEAVLRSGGAWRWFCSSHKDMHAHTSWPVGETQHAVHAVSTPGGVWITANPVTCDLHAHTVWQYKHQHHTTVAQPSAHPHPPNCPRKQLQGNTPSMWVQYTCSSNSTSKACCASCALA